MNEKNTLKKLTFTAIVLLFVLSLVVKDGFSAVVSEDEAIAVADLWYAMELNSGYAKIAEPERAERLGKLQNRQVLYLVSKDDLLDSRPTKGDVLAYVIKYDPSGFVVVSGEDRLEPVMVFGAESQFRWDQPERNFLRYFLGKEMTERWECLTTQQAKGTQVEVHRNWSYLRSELQKTISLQEVTLETGAIFVHWDTALWSQFWPYNTTVVANNGNTTGIPTGCVATAMAIKMRFHEWPTSGSGSHGYDDNEGDVRYSHWINFVAQSYSWSAMPTGSLTSANLHVANLMYHCGVGVDMNYEVGSSGAETLDVATAMGDYFRYWGGQRRTSDHTKWVTESVLAGLPVVSAATSHAFVIDGYRDTQSPYFHVNAGWNGDCNGWYNLSGLPNNPNGCGTGAITKSCTCSSPANYIYVDLVWSVTGSTGLLSHPFKYLSPGVAAVPAGGHLWIKEARYSGADNVPITINKPMTIRSYGGSSGGRTIIGENLLLTTATGDNLSLRCPAQIRIYSGGGLRIY